MAIRFNEQKAAAKGYTKEDWDAVSDNPPLTDEEIKSLKPAKDVLPASFFEGLDEARKARGRPAVDNPKQPITIRLHQDTIAKFKATGKGWQSKISDILDQAKL